jgi:hypothetical protein
MSTTPRRRATDVRRLDAERSLLRSQIKPERRAFPATRDQALRRIRSDFLELSGLKVTAAQAARVGWLDAALCASILEELAERGLLIRAGELYRLR